MILFKRFDIFLLVLINNCSFPLSMLVVATSGAGFVLGSGPIIDFAGLCCTCVGTMMVAASANSLNQVCHLDYSATTLSETNSPH